MSDAEPTIETYRYDNLVILKRRIALAEITEAVYHSALDHPLHDHRQACFLLTGNCDYREQLGSKTSRYSPNTILWRPTDISHSDGIEGNGGCAFSVFIKDGLLDRVSEYSKIPAEFAEKNTYLVFLANRLRSEFRNWAAGSELIAEGLVLEMLGYVAKKRIPADKTAPKWIARVVEKLDDEFLESHTNLELASQVGVHPVHLARTFRKYYGKSIGTYLKEKRVDCAIQLIKQDKLTLSEIAYSSGFSDQSQLTRAFKELAGITPGAFRDEVTKARPSSVNG